MWGSGKLMNSLRACADADVVEEGWSLMLEFQAAGEGGILPVAAKGNF